MMLSVGNYMSVASKNFSAKKKLLIFFQVHIVFPICLFGNLAITAAFTWIGPHTDDRQRSLIYFTPVGVVAIVILTYGIIISIRLFNCSEPVTMQNEQKNTGKLITILN